jgi:hypothetical protein
MANLITAGIFHTDALKTPLLCVILLLLIGVYIFNMLSPPAHLQSKYALMQLTPAHINSHRSHSLCIPRSRTRYQITTP